MRCKQLSVSSGRKVEVPEAWRKIKAIVSDPRQKPYDRYSAEGIKAELSELREEMRVFWNDRFTRGHLMTPPPRLFVPSKFWSEHMHFAGLELKSRTLGKTTDSYYPSEDAMHLFILLSEQVFVSSLDSVLEQTFWHFRIMREGNDPLLHLDRLVEILHPDALMRLIHCIGGECFAELLRESGEHDLHNRDGRLVDKIADTLTNAELTTPVLGYGSPLRKLGDYLIHYPSMSILQILKNAKDERAPKAAEQLIKHIRRTIHLVQEEMGTYLQGEQHESA